MTKNRNCWFRSMLFAGLCSLCLVEGVFAQIDTKASASDLQVLDNQGQRVEHFEAYLIFDHLMTIRRKDLMPEGLSEQVRTSLMAGDIKSAKAACGENPSFLSFVLMHGINELEFGWNAVEKSVEDALAEQSARLFRKIEYLSVIGNIAPMVGLLGTVIGMIMAFQQVATPGMTSAPQLAEGIYQALVTTVGGLIVAIPAIGAFAIFRNRIDQFVAEAAYLTQHVFSPLRRKAKRS